MLALACPTSLGEVQVPVIPCNCFRPDHPHQRHQRGGNGDHSALL